MKNTLFFLILSFGLLLTAQSSRVELVPETGKEKTPPGIRITTENLPLISGGELLLYDKGWRDLTLGAPEKTVRRPGEAEREQRLITESAFWSQSIVIRSSSNPLVIEKFKKGEFGKKTGKGWYDYSGENKS